MPTATSPQTPPEASPYARHIPALDGVRGLAILGVIGSHFFNGTATSTLTRLMQSVLAFGATGVDLFFALSGFLITGILYDSLGDGHFFRKFYARRALRIFPLYYGVIVICLLLNLFGHRHDGAELLSLSLYLQNTSLIAPAIYLYASLPLAHFWSLAVEEQFYLVWPVVVFLLRKRRSLLAVAFASFFLCPLLRILFALHGMDRLVIHVSTLLRADALLAGGALALLLRSKQHDRILRLAPWLLLLSVGVLLVLGCAPLRPFLLTNLGGALAQGISQSAYPIGGVALIALSLRNGVVARVFSISPLRMLGKYSYGLYVLHIILFSFLREPLRNFLSQHVTHNKAAMVALPGLAGFVLTFFAAYLSYNLYEKPFLRLKKYFDYRPHRDTVR